MANQVNTQYYELIAPEQPGNGQFTTDGSAATLDFIVPIDLISTFARDCLGSCTLNAAGVPNGDGFLYRSLPLSHPTFSYMYASAITNIQGIGMDGRTKVGEFPSSFRMGDVDYSAPVWQGVYQKYRVTVKFETRPYLVLSDQQLRGLQGCGATYNYSVRTQTGIQNASYKDWFEWVRFCSLDVEPNVEVITNNNGQYFFRSNNQPAGENGPSDSKPISNQNSGATFIVESRNLIKITWYFVPLQMSFSSGISNGTNKVNFGCDFGNLDCVSNFFNYGYKFFGYPSGSLLFVGPTVKQYSAAFPPFVWQNNTPDNTFNSWLNQTYCDITFTFIEKQVPNDQIGDLPDRTQLANQYGKIIYGHNMVPFSANKKYYYIESDSTPANGYPIHWSYPFQRMFQYIP